MYQNFLLVMGAKGLEYMFKTLDTKSIKSFYGSGMMGVPELWGLVNGPFHGRWRGGKSRD